MCHLLIIIKSDLNISGFVQGCLIEINIDKYNYKKRILKMSGASIATGVVGEFFCYF